MIVIDVKGDIVSDDVGGFYSFFGVGGYTCPSIVSEALSADDSDKEVVVNIASNGGDVFAASEIYTMLKSAQKNITVNIQGLAASAASVIAMAGDQINISPTAQIMIHKAMVDSGGNADDLTHDALVLIGIDESIASTYEARTGISHDDILQMMASETWLTAKDAVDKGFADEIMFQDDAVPVFSNSLSSIPGKEAVNKFMNLLKDHEQLKNIQEKSVHKLDKLNEIQDQEKSNKASLRERKLAILLNKN